MVKQRVIAILAWFASVFALCVIALGAFTRLIDAGLGCPDWPGCYGHLTVSAAEKAGVAMVAYKAWAEMVHRYFAGTLSMLIMTIVVLIMLRAWSNRHIKNEPWKLNVTLAIGLVLLVTYQIILGQWTVTLKLLPIIVTQHLLGGYLILSTAWLIYLNNKKTALHDSHQSIYYLIASCIGLVVLLAQIMLGAWTSTNYASLSCIDFPFCNNDHIAAPLYFKEAFNVFSPVGVNYEGGVLPTVVRQTIQMAHRIGAFVVMCYLFVFGAIIMLRMKGSQDVIRLVYVLFGLLCLQMCFGISNVIFKLPLSTAIAHNVTAVLLLLTMITITFKLASRRQS